MTGPNLSTAICALLDIVARGAAPHQVLRFWANAGHRRGAPAEILLPVGNLSPRWLPPAVLTALETDSAAPWTVGLTVQDRLAVLAAVFHFGRVYENPKDSTLKTGRGWIWPDAQIRAADRAQAFLPASVIVNGRETLTVLWALSDPIDLRRDRDRAVRLLQRVAVAVGAAVPDDDVDLDRLEVALPGFAVRNSNPLDEERVVCTLLDVDRLYSIPAIEQALEASTAPAIVPTPAPRRRTPKEAA